MTTGNYTVLSPKAFLNDVKNEATKAKKRVWAQAMEIEPGEITDTFLSIFPEAAKRGVDTRLHVDHYSLMVTDGRFNYLDTVIPGFIKKRKRRKSAKLEMAENLIKSGVKLRYTNRPTILDSLFPMRGRNHMKIVVVDKVCWIGGVNFHDENFLIDDLMVKITVPEIVSEIAYIYEQVDRGEVLRDMAISCTADSTLLIDGGRINHSIILRHAVELAESAEKEIKVISPIIPDAAFLTALNSTSKAGKDVKVIVPKIERMTGLYEVLDIFNDFVMKIKGRTIPLIVKNRMIHAKVLIVDRKEVIFGSHNLTSRGVRMGTEEIALQSSDKTLVKNMLQYYDALEKIDTTDEH